MNASQPSTYTYTGLESPFHSSASSKGADLIIQSADNIDFYVHRSLLAYQSTESFFSALFTCSFPSAADLHRDSGLPLVRVEEPASTIYPLLRVCYPMEASSSCTSAYEFGLVVDAAGKYGLDAALTRLLHIAMSSRKMVAESPVSMYCLAVTYRWRELTVAAGRACLSVPLDKILTCKRLKSISATQLLRLLEYWQACRKLVTENIVDAMRRGRPGCEPVWKSAGNIYKVHGSYVSDDSRHIVYATMLSCLHNVPGPSAMGVTWEAKLMALSDELDARCGLQRIQNEFPGYIEYLEKVIDKVELKTDF